MRSILVVMAAFLLIAAVDILIQSTNRRNRQVLFDITNETNSVVKIQESIDSSSEFAVLQPHGQTRVVSVMPLQLMFEYVPKLHDARKVCFFEDNSSVNRVEIRISPDSISVVPDSVLGGAQNYHSIKGAKK